MECQKKKQKQRTLCTNLGQAILLLLLLLLSCIHVCVKKNITQQTTNVLKLDGLKKRKSTKSFHTRKTCLFCASTAVNRTGLQLLEQSNERKSMLLVKVRTIKIIVENLLLNQDKYCTLYLQFIFG